LSTPILTFLLVLFFSEATGFYPNKPYLFSDTTDSILRTSPKDSLNQPFLQLSTTPGQSPGKPWNQTQKNKQLVLRRVTYFALTISVISTVAAYYYTSEGDEAYHQYLQAGNPSDMNHFFHQTKTFDQRAGYSLVVFEISFLTALLSFFFTLIP